MKTEIVKIETTQLDEVVKNSGLAIKEADEIKLAYLPFLSQLATIQGQAGEIDFETPGMNDEMKARELRLLTVKVRTAAEKQKDERKKLSLLRGNMEQHSYNLIASSCKLTEELFAQVEKAREIAEKARKELLKQERIALISPFVEDTNTFMLGEMTEAAFSTLIAGAKSQFEAKKEEERKAEEARQEADRKRQLHLDRKDSILPLWNYLPEADRSMNFGEIDNSNWMALYEGLQQKKIVADKKAEADRKEKERLEKEAKVKERELEAERARVRAEQEKKDAEIKKARDEAEAAKREKDRIEAEQKAKIEADRKEKEAAEKKAKDAEKKALRAPDKTKLLILASDLDNFTLPELKTPEGEAIKENIRILIGKTTAYIRAKAEEL